MSTSEIEVDPAELLGFFDEAPTNSLGHATAIVAVAGEELGAALLVDYLGSVGRQASVLPGPCTPGTRSGARLDRWIEVMEDPPTLYQVEIKNWSAHAIGGTRLPRDASPELVAAHAAQEWSAHWNGQSFNGDHMQKVLMPMRPPRLGCRVLPLIAFWGVVHATEVVFTVPVPGNPVFPDVTVFSMSAYLRRNLGRTLHLEMPLTTQRIAWLQRLFPIPSVSAGGEPNPAMQPPGCAGGRLRR